MFNLYKWLKENYPQDKVFKRREIEDAFFLKAMEVNEICGPTFFHMSATRADFTPINGVGCGCFSWQESEFGPTFHEYIYFYEEV